MCPPEITIRVGCLSSCNDGTCMSALIDGHNLDGVQIIRRESQLAAEKAKRATDDVSTHSDFRIFTEWNHDAPIVEQSPECFTDSCPCFNRDSAPFFVEVNALHRR